MKKSPKPTATSIHDSSTRPISGGPTGPQTATTAGPRGDQPSGVGGLSGAGAPNPSAPTVVMSPPMAPPERPIKRGPSAATIIWGLIVLFVGVTLMALALNVYLDIAIFAVVLLTLGGLALIAGAVKAATRRGRP